MTPEARLRSLLARRSLQLGDFTLASGARSTYYIDARLTTMSSEGQVLVGRVCYDLIRSSGLEVTHVGGLTLGADPITYAIAHESWTRERPLDGFTVRKSAKEHGTGRRIEGSLPRDARVAVVEDTLTTGRSALEAVEAVRSHGAAVEALLVLVDRSGDGGSLVDKSGIPVLTAFTARDLLDEARGEAERSGAGGGADGREGSAKPSRSEGDS